MPAWAWTNEIKRMLKSYYVNDILEGRLGHKRPIVQILQNVPSPLREARELHVDAENNRAVVLIDSVFGLLLLGALMRGFIQQGFSWDVLTFGIDSVQVKYSGHVMPPKPFMVIDITSASDFNDNRLIIKGLQKIKETTN